MKIISWNTNGLRATIKQGYFEPLFEKYDPDILCLQETKAESDQIAPEIRNHKNYFSYFASSKVKKGHSGVAIFSKVEPKKVEYGIGTPLFDDQGRTLVAYYADFVLVNCYFPNGGGGPEKLKYKLDFYDAFLEFANTLKKKYKQVIVCGDVNVAHEAIDLARPKENEMHVGFLPEERAWFDEVLSVGWTDVFRHVYPTKRDAYTYWDTYTHARERNVGWRIDYFLASKSLKPKIKKAEIHADIMGSDHCPVSLELEL